MANFCDDSYLLNQFSNGNPYSFESLFLKHKKRIFNYINSKVGDSDISNDLLQETFIKVFKVLKTGTYNEQGKFLSWVLRISHNLIMDYFRTKKRSKVVFEKDLNFMISNINYGFEDNREKIISDKTLTNLISQIIEKLPDEQKEIVKLRFFQNFSFREIAEMNNISINTALGRVRYSIKNLRKQMNKTKFSKELQESY